MKNKIGWSWIIGFFIVYGLLVLWNENNQKNQAMEQAMWKRAQFDARVSRVAKMKLANGEPLNAVESEVVLDDLNDTHYRHFKD